MKDKGKPIKRVEQSRKSPRPNEELFNIPASPEEVARSLFRGKPKPKGQWRYLKWSGEPDEKA